MQDNINIRNIKKRATHTIYVLVMFFALVCVVISYLSFSGYFKKGRLYLLQNDRKVRRDIVDRQGNILAINIPSISVSLRPKEIKDKDAAVTALIQSLDLPKEVVIKMVYSKSNFIWVKRNITQKEDYKLKLYGIIGIYFEKEQKRFYPQGNLFSHVVGLTNIDGKGLSGVESYFDKTLYDNNVELSLDLKIQNALYEVLSKAIKNNKAQYAYGMVVDPNTSEVLAMVSLPDFNPNERVLIDVKNMFNYPTQGLFEPGSIAKVFSVAMALQNKNHTIANTYDVSKPIVKNKFIIVDFEYMNKILNIPEILMYSSNIGTSLLMRELGISKQIEYLNKFNLFKETSIEINEKEPPLTAERWSELNSMTASYGYGIAVSQATFMNSFIAIINGGMYRPLTILKANSTENISDIGTRVLDEDISKQMRRILRLVVAKGYGSRANVKGYSVGGKTGSAEKQAKGKYEQNKVISSFVAFFPSDKPRYAIIISIDEPKRLAINNYNITGGSVSSPVAYEMIDRLGTIFAIEKNFDGVETINERNSIEILNYVKGEGNAD